jgi:hypothetical protein
LIRELAHESSELVVSQTEAYGCFALVELGKLERFPQAMQLELFHGRLQRQG